MIFALKYIFAAGHPCRRQVVRDVFSTRHFVLLVLSTEPGVSSGTGVL